MSPEEVGKEVRSLLKQCGLPEDYALRYPHEVSGGECQRAAAARALAVRPEILICDEATSALDVTVQKQIVKLLENLREQYGISCIFISHDRPLAQSFGSRVLVTKEGRIVEEGTADEVLLNPKNEYTKRSRWRCAVKL